MKQEKNDKVSNLTDFLKDINKTFGDNSLVRIGDVERPHINVLPTGIASFDIALGGGFAEGRLAECFGMESGGKTSLLLLTIAEAQKKGHLCGFIDVEQALDFEYAEFLGVKVDDLVVNQPDSAEQALEILDRMVESGLFKIIVLDSIAALTPKSEIEGEMGDQRMGVIAKLMAQALRKITGKANKTGTAVLFVNQLRDVLNSYVPTTITPGGKSMKFFASQRVEVSKGTQIKNGDEVIGYNMKIKVVKNKISVPFKKAEVENIYGKGIDRLKDLLSVAVTQDIIQRAGSWYSYGDVKLGQGLDKTKDILEDNQELLDEIISKIKY